MKGGDKTGAAKRDLRNMKMRGMEEMEKKMPVCKGHAEFMSKDVKVRHGKGEFKEGSR